MNDFKKQQQQQEEQEEDKKESRRENIKQRTRAKKEITDNDKLTSQNKKEFKNKKISIEEDELWEDWESGNNKE